VAQRFQIEDLVVQDAAGVIFQALDTETGRPVALRRFFPFGRNGGGLGEVDQVTFAADLQTLSGIQHPVLRPILSGGCDPVDQMPYMAADWMEALSLAKKVEEGPLAPECARRLLDEMLEVSQMVSQALGHEALWVETGLDSILSRGGAEEDGFTCWITPVKWMKATDETRKGLLPLVKLTEEIMHWRGKAVIETSGQGLGAWFRWLRTAAQTATLHQARQRLAEGPAAATASGIPSRTTPSLKVPVVKTSTARGPTVNKAASAPKSVAEPKRRAKAPARLIGLSAFVLVSAAVGGWVVVQKKPSLLGGLAPAEPEEVLSTASILEDLEKNKKAADRASAPIAAASEISARVYLPEDSKELLQQNGREVLLTGTARKIDHSNKKRTLYLLFSDNPVTTDTRIGITVKGAPADLSESELASLIGKKLKVRGRVRAEGSGKMARPAVMIGSRNAIQMVE
jgi:hypothetical protein